MEILAESYVSPPPGSVPSTSIPLTFFDILFYVTLPVHWMQRLFFYEFKHSASYFVETVFPDLKTSLSLALQRFFPLAGNLVFPPPPRMPYILYQEGDSVSFVVKESAADFSHLVGDHARDYREFQLLLPGIPHAIASAYKQEPVMAIQVTVFPDVGISIGVGFSHVAADGRTFAHFMKSWTPIHSRRGDSTSLNDCLPCFDRDVIDDPLELASILTKRTFQGTISPNIVLNNFRVTYKITRSEVELLKEWVKRNSTEYVSTYVVTCAYMWVCLIKLQQLGTHLPHIDPNALSYFLFLADCRGYLKVPETYFGNCVMFRLTSAKKSELLGENGIAVAATAIGREITEFWKQPFRNAQESWPKIIEKHKMGKDVTLAISSPKFGLYRTDFGWGRPVKTEIGFLRSFGSRSMICMAESRDDEGSVEFALAFASHELESFNAIFMEGLLKLQTYSSK